MATTSDRRHETAALLRAHLSAATRYRHATRRCPVCHRLRLLAAQEPAQEPAQETTARETTARETTARETTAQRPARETEQEAAQGPVRRADGTGGADGACAPTPRGTRALGEAGDVRTVAAPDAAGHVAPEAAEDQRPSLQ
ncbi:DUF6274 family protein [Streptomyces sp. TRM 70351]|uniref:DUF6274 family protein n=1 Tax=Streptomyces sp. TRM 70351 TaxID=3116552 RepID=UPI002E7B0883|nr:DUF6274 family protein [Streptomyces sp. TRM 70351]MEE1929847.1 DUF6274 family protein [Streptomyces sp. TRM 70351]